MNTVNEKIEKMEQELAELDQMAKALAEKREILSVYQDRNEEDSVVSSEKMVELIDKQKRENIGAEKYHTGIGGLDEIIGGFRPGTVNVVTAPTGEGKCLGGSTKLIMHDGTIKEVQDVQVGDKLMGDDSTPRNVLSTTKGKGALYEVKQKKGIDYVVNREHILCLKRTNDGTGFTGTAREISVSEYLDKSKTFKHIHKGYKVGVDFNTKEQDVEPYFLGLWIGDGTKADQTVTNPDKEIVKYLREYGERLGMELTVQDSRGTRCTNWRICGKKGKKNKLLEMLRKNNVINNKHIPHHYKTGDRNQRLELLAGLVDADGHYSHGCFELINKDKGVSEDIAFLIRSLGIGVTVSEKIGKIKSIGFEGKYYRLKIYGNLDEIPTKIKRKQARKRLQKKNHLVTGIAVEQRESGDYYGFQIDGNKRFLLEDFTVTHNTTLLTTFTSNMAEKKTSCMWFTYEVSNEELINKFPTVPNFCLPKIYRNASMDWLESRMFEGMAKFGVQVVFIDHLHYLLDMTDMAVAKSMSMLIGNSLRRLKLFANKWKLCIFLVAHLRKTQLDKSAEIDDIRDSSFIGQESDTVLAIWRHFKKKKDVSGITYRDFTNESRIKVLKHRRTGKLGLVYLEMGEEGQFQEIFSPSPETHFPNLY